MGPESQEVVLSGQLLNLREEVQRLAGPDSSRLKKTT